MWNAVAVVALAFAIVVAGAFGRYELQANGGGILRLDRLTGEVVQCGVSERGSLKITCQKE